jgi:hypothetical protein
MSNCTRANVIIVATNADRCTNSEEVIRSVKEKYGSLNAIHLHGVFAVNSLSRSSLEAVSTLLVSLGDKIFSKTIMAPCSHFGLLNSMLQEENQPIITVGRFNGICDACMVPALKRQCVLQCLRQSGLVLWCDLPELRDLVVVDLGWMVQSLTNLFQYDCGSNVRLSDSSLNQIWPSYQFPHRTRPYLMTLLEQFGLMHRLEYV